jgi:L-lactate dehydrogenase (cytochrome)
MPTSLPIYFSPTAMAKLGHPLGETNITKAAATQGLIQGLSANSSCSLEEVVEAGAEGQNLIYQVYLNKDRKGKRGLKCRHRKFGQRNGVFIPCFSLTASAKLLQKVEQMGFKGIMFTVDTAMNGFRELDVRAKHSSEPVSHSPLP